MTFSGSPSLNSSSAPLSKQCRTKPPSPLLSASRALHSCRFKLIAFLPTHQFGLRRGLPPQHKSEPRHRRIAGKIHARVIFVARLVVVLRSELFGLLQAPSSVVALILRAFVDRESGNADACQAEM